VSPPRVLFYVQHLLGIGHLRRAAILARALTKRGMATTLVSGGRSLPDLDVGGARFVQLPPVRAADATFKTLLDENDRVIDDQWRRQRARRLLGALAEAQPDSVILEMYPFGRRQMRFELGPLIQEIELMQPRPLLLSSVRDVLVDKKDPRRAAEIAELVERDFDAVLVHGDPRVLRFDESFSAAARIQEKLRYTGYVVAPLAAPRDPRSGEVVVSAGGGAVGGRLIEAAMAARKLTTLSRQTWRIVTGDNLDKAAFDFFRNWAPTGIVVERWRNDLARLLPNADLAISQAGYNTVMEILSAGVPAVVVPFADAGENEQTRRAERLAELGLLTVVPAAAVGGETLAEGVAAALARKRATMTIDLGGAAATAELVLNLLRQRRDHGVA